MSLLSQNKKFITWLWKRSTFDLEATCNFLWSFYAFVLLTLSSILLSKHTLNTWTRSLTVQPPLTGVCQTCLRMYMSVDKNSTSMVPINNTVSLTLDYEQSFLICDAVARVIDSQPKNKIAVGESRGTLSVLTSIHFHCFFFHLIRATDSVKKNGTALSQRLHGSM